MNIDEKTYIVKYTGNNLGEIQTDKWIGSIFEAKSHWESWNAIRIIHKEKPFTLDTMLPSFYKYNAELIPCYDSYGTFPNSLFVLE